MDKQSNAPGVLDRSQPLIHQRAPKTQPFLVQHELDDLVSQMRADAATANIVVQPLRGNVSVLMGSGGNIRRWGSLVPPRSFTRTVYGGV